jgi:hypothetical protein
MISPSTSRISKSVCTQKINMPSDRPNAVPKFSVITWELDRTVKHVPLSTDSQTRSAGDTKSFLVMNPASNAPSSTEYSGTYFVVKGKQSAELPPELANRYHDPDYLRRSTQIHPSYPPHPRPKREPRGAVGSTLLARAPRNLRSGISRGGELIAISHRENAARFRSRYKTHLHSHSKLSPGQVSPLG